MRTSEQQFDADRTLLQHSQRRFKRSAATPDDATFAVLVDDAQRLALTALLAQSSRTNVALATIEIGFSDNAMADPFLGAGRGDDVSHTCGRARP